MDVVLKITLRLIATQKCATRKGLKVLSYFLQVILHKLEESVSEQTDVDQRLAAGNDVMDSLNTEEAADGQQPQSGLDEARIREFLSTKNLKTVRNDSSRRSSSCFGRRMDRIGSMSSLGCNTVGRYSKLQYLCCNTPQLLCV